VRELQALVAPKLSQGVSVRGRAGLVINKLSQSTPNAKHPNSARTGCGVQGSGVFGSRFGVQGARLACGQSNAS